MPKPHERWERVTCHDVSVGDRIARTRTETPQAVVHIHEGQTSRRLFFTYKVPEWGRKAARNEPWGDNIRPRRTAKLWRVAE